MKSVVLSGLLATITFLAACGGGGGGNGNSNEPPIFPPAQRNVVVSEYSGNDPSRPKYVVANIDGDRIDVFGAMNTAGDFVPSQAALKSAGSSAGSGNEYTVFFDANGMPERINDEANNRYVLITRMDGGTQYEMYNSSNVFAGGIAILEDDTGPRSVALIEGEPAFEGQLIGQLTGAVNGSFAVVAIPDSGLGAPGALPPMLREYLRVDPNAISSKALSSGIDALIRAGATTYIVGGAVAAGLVTLAGGATVIAAGVAASQVALVGFGVALVAVTVRAGLQNIRGDIPEGEGRDMFDSIFGSISEEASGESFLDNARAEAQSIAQRGIAALENLADGFLDRAGTASDTVAQLMSPFTQPQPVQGPPRIDTEVSGFGVDSSDRQYEYTGQVDADGSINLNGTANGGATQIQIAGTLDADDDQVSGTYSGTAGSGTVSGSASEFGTCQTVQNSGGQGTFSFVSDVGAVGGTVDFDYEAFTIPDAFTVRNDGATVFSTGGLVSGSGSTTFTAASSIVFVNVSAPNDGTAWEYELGCSI